MAIQRIDKGDVVIFKRGNDEMVGLYRKGKMFGNAVYQRRYGSMVRNIVADLDNIDEWINRESLSEEEFLKLRALIKDNAVAW